MIKKIYNESDYLDLYPSLLDFVRDNNLPCCAREFGIVNEALEEHLKVSILDVEDFIKKNRVEEVSDSLLFIRKGVPTEKGLLSNEIFGITKDERANKFGYIDLTDWFIHPFIYKIWTRLDSNIREIVHGTAKFRLDENGYIVEDANGSTGIQFIYKNIDKIRIKSTGAASREEKIKFIYNNKKNMFIKKFLVMPAYYRDVDTKANGAVSTGALNKYYQSLLISTKSMKDTQDYGMNVEDSIKGRIQETLLSISNCLFGTSKNKDDGDGLSGKTGYMRSKVMSKTTDYGVRLVLSAPQLKVESVEDLMVNADYAALPLAAACVNFYPFIIFHVKRFFENQFTGNLKQTYYNPKTKKLEEFEVPDPYIQFSDEVIKEHIKKFIYGYSNRLEPITITSGGKQYDLVFKGKGSGSTEKFEKQDHIGESSLVERSLTWCDLFYMAACETVKDKYVLVTRYPMDSYFNQFPTKVRISTIKQMEPIYVNGTYYQFYPRIRQEDIGSNTSNKFIDTMQFSNIYLKSIVGDYDGDQVSVKAVWTKEANEELDRYANSKTVFIDIGGSNVKVSTNETIQALYSLTKILKDDEKKLTDPIF